MSEPELEGRPIGLLVRPMLLPATNIIISITASPMSLGPAISVSRRSAAQYFVAASVVIRQVYVICYTGEDQVLNYGLPRYVEFSMPVDTTVLLSLFTFRILCNRF